MDNAQKELRAFLDQWRTNHEQSDTDMVQQLMEAATHYAPQHQFVREAISNAWLWAIAADMPHYASQPST